MKKSTEAKDAAVKIATDSARRSESCSGSIAQAKKAFDKSAEAKAAAEKMLQDLQTKNTGVDPAAKPTPDTLKAAEAKFESAKLAFERDMAMNVTAEKAAQEAGAKSKAAGEARAAAEKAVTDATTKNTEATTKIQSG